MSIRDIKRFARGKVHEQMSLPLLYINSQNPTGILTRARLHKNDGLTGQLRGLAMKVVEAFEESPKAIFSNADLVIAGITLAKGAHISFLPSEAYRIENFYPQDDEYRTVELSRLTIEQSLSLPSP